MGVGAALGPILAVQDRDCIDRAKFRYELEAPLPESAFAHFPEATIVVRRFSELVPLGRDLFSIRQTNAFRIDGVLGDSTLIVAFEGDAKTWPMPLLRDVEHKLGAVGYGSISYVGGVGPDCAACALRSAKKCQLG